MHFAFRYARRTCNERPCRHACAFLCALIDRRLDVFFFTWVNKVLLIVPKLPYEMQYNPNRNTGDVRRKVIQGRAMQSQVRINRVLSCRKSLADNIQSYLKKRTKPPQRRLQEGVYIVRTKYTAEVHQSRLSASLNSTPKYLKETPEMTQSLCNTLIWIWRALRSTQIK